MTCEAAGCERAAVARGFCKAHWHRWRRYGDPAGGFYEQGRLSAWIDAHVHHDGEDCLVWPFGRTSRGAGAISISGKQAPAARVMCERRYGPPPTPRHEAAHSCGKGHEGCCNPNHLRWADPGENQRDRVIHGTDVRGERAGRARLTRDDVRVIRSLCDAGENQHDIAARFGVSNSAVWAIHHRRTWAWLEE